MSKLFKLKKWLTLEDASKRLSSILEEEVNTNDLIQLIIEGELKVSWYFKVNQGIEAVKVIKDNVYVLGPVKGEEFLSTNTPLKYITDAQANIPEGEVFRIFIDSEMPDWSTCVYHDYRETSGIFDIEGPFNIHINSGDMKTYFENILFDTRSDFESEYFTGIIVEDGEGDLFKIVLHCLDEDDKREYRIPNWAQYPYPMKEYPKQSDLVILRSDLEKFEQAINNHSIEIPQSSIGLDDQILKTKTLNTLFESIKKGVDKFPNWSAQQRYKNNIQMRDVDEWLYESITSTKREAEIVKKVIIEIFNLKKSIN